MGRMIAFVLLVSALFAQGVPVLPNQGGTVAGVLRTAAGAPAVGVRVAALALPEAIKDLASSSSFAGLGETDAAGRYRLENIAPGRYYIVAGRVDAPTYYPGTVRPAEGTVVSIAPGVTVPGVDFVLNNASVGRASADSSGNPGWVVGLLVRVEGGGKVPLFASGRFPVLRFTRMNARQIDAALNVPNVTLPYPDYRVTLEDLPEGYSLKSLTFGSLDLKTSALQFAGVTNSANLTPAQVVALVLATPPAPVGQSISVVLTPPSVQSTRGVRVVGRIQGDARRSIYISGNPGAIYSDGTFEFVGVPQGRHTIVSLDTSLGNRSLGASLVVGDRDLVNVELEEVALAPAEPDRPTAPAAAGTHLPGSRIPTASIRGRVVDGDTHEPFNAGKVVINSNYSVTFSLNDDGRFEVAKLLPGKYVVEAIAFGIGTVSREVTIDEQDVSVDLSIGGDGGGLRQ